LFVQHFGIQGMLKRLFAEFVSSEMVASLVGGNGRRMETGCQPVEFRSSILGALGHLAS
jgi:hypothetical protein